MDHLLDDVLLQVMRYLEVPDLLACRLVCKRLGGLVLHPDVWCHRSLAEDDPWSVPVWRLAPCLKSARLNIKSQPSSIRQLLCTVTKCAVSELKLFVEETPGTAARASTVIRNQEALGRLRSLKVLMFVRTKSGLDDATVLLYVVAAASGLLSLDITIRCRFDSECLFVAPSLVIPEPRPSLTYFSSGLDPPVAPFRDFLLASHATTLEEVHVTGTGGGDFATLPAPLLAKMPHLRVLRCPLLPGLEVVATCASLREVSLIVAASSEGSQAATDVAGAAAFLGRASQLRTVTLEYREVYYDLLCDVGRDLVLALVSSGRSLVESLVITCEDCEEEDRPPLQPLIMALPLMPALQCLTLGTAVSDELLLSITPDTTPALRTIKLLFEENRPCVHGLLHQKSVEKILCKNPSLELLIYGSYFCEEDNLCEWCELDCHQDDEYEHASGWLTVPRLQ